VLRKDMENVMGFNGIATVLGFWGFGRVKVIVHLIICSVYGLIIEEVNGSILRS
jgi:hypothetical protein